MKQQTIYIEVKGRTSFVVEIDDDNELNDFEKQQLAEEFLREYSFDLDEYEIEVE